MSDLNHDSEPNYCEDDQKAEKALQKFSHALNNVYLQYKYLLHENILLAKTNERLKKVIDDHKLNYQVTKIIEIPSSDKIVKSSSNCKLKRVSNNENNNLADKPFNIVQKENVNKFSSVRVEDSTKHIRDQILSDDKSQSVLDVNTSVKLQSSPILSNSKKSNSKTGKAFQYKPSKSINYALNLSEQFEKESPLKPIQNILQSPSIIRENSRQAVLRSKKVDQATDISKVHVNRRNCLSEPSTSNKNMVLEVEESLSCSSDATFYSQAEMANYKNRTTDLEDDFTKSEDDDMTYCETPSAKRMLLNSFDIIPGRVEESPDFVYKESAVRKKSEKDKLPGWSCRDCERYYEYLPKKERKQRKNLCSRHRGKYKPQVDTPESFWNPVFSESDDDMKKLLD